MVFSSAIFLFAFLPAVCLLDRLSGSIRWKNAVLGVSSLVFYAFGQLRFLPLFLLSVLINYTAGVLLPRSRRPRALLAAAVVLNLAILGVFKYTDFVLTSLGLPPVGILLPIGISFYTFQGMSYVIDVYRSPESGTRRFDELLLYLAFFPQLIAGPIVKYHEIAPQLRERSVDPESAEEGILRFVRGLAKKLMLADAVGYVSDAVFSRGTGDWRLAWLAALCYTLQIYYDFSGYSDMAIGMGRMFGFRIPENFRRPYAALSIRDFWRRWHISLSSWFKEYLYIPLGGSRRGRLRAALNRLLVFLCTGIWHGANWTFVVWGLGHGLLSSLEGWGLVPVQRLQKNAWGRLLCRVYTMFCVTLLFTVFRAPDLAAAGEMLRSMFCGAVSPEGTLMLAKLLSPAFGLCFLLALLFSQELPEPRLPRGLRRAGGLLLLILSMLSLSKGGFHPFIYYQF